MNYNEVLKDVLNSLGFKYEVVEYSVDNDGIYCVKMIFNEANIPYNNYILGCGRSLDSAYFNILKMVIKESKYATT